VRRALLFLLALVLGLAGCGGGDDGQSAAAPADGVRDLANVLELRSDFEADMGKTRLLVLLSPT
jgi:ABC-type glycerol-3-phosphate transport system substrate-binding protein